MDKYLLAEILGYHDYICWKDKIKYVNYEYLVRYFMSSDSWYTDNDGNFCEWYVMICRFCHNIMCNYRYLPKKEQDSINRMCYREYICQRRRYNSFLHMNYYDNMIKLPLNY